MESKKKEVESSSERAKVWASLVASALGVIAGLLSSLATAAKLFGLPRAIVAAGAAVAITAAFTFVLARRERGSSRLAKLKDEITDAYLGALERSSLNPLREGPR